MRRCTPAPRRLLLVIPGSVEARHLVNDVDGAAPLYSNSKLWDADFPLSLNVKLVYKCNRSDSASSHSGVYIE